MVGNVAAFSHWLSDTTLSGSLGSHEWVVPAVQTVHILAIAVIITSSAMLDVRLAGWLDRHQSLRVAAARFLPLFWYALAVLAATGLVLIIAEPDRELLNMLFWTKMGLVTAVALIMFQTGAHLEDATFDALSGRGRLVVRSGAVISLLLLLAIIWCGRWIGYTQ